MSSKAKAKGLEQDFIHAPYTEKPPVVIALATEILQLESTLSSIKQQICISFHVY